MVQQSFALKRLSDWMNQHAAGISHLAEAIHTTPAQVSRYFGIGGKRIRPSLRAAVMIEMVAGIAPSEWFIEYGGVIAPPPKYVRPKKEKPPRSGHPGRKPGQKRHEALPIDWRQQLRHLVMGKFRKLTQVEVARRVGRSKEAVSQWAYGKASPRGEAAKELAALLAAYRRP